MHFTKLISTLALFAASAGAAPIELASRDATIPQASLQTAETAVREYVQAHDGRRNQYNHIGEIVNKYIPLSATADQILGADTVLAIDILADRLCIAGSNQGSVCNEVFAYAYALTMAQEKSMTFRTVAEAIGQDNVNQFNSNLRVLCLGPDNAQQAQWGLCQFVLEDTDVLANSLIGTSDLSEDAKNTNTLNQLGLTCLYRNTCAPTILP